MRGRGSAVRRVLAVFLALIAAVSLVVGAVSLAARQTIYDPGNAADVAARLLDEPAVRLAIAEKLLWKEYRAGQTILVDVRDGEIVFESASVLPPDIPPVELAGSSES